MNNILNVRIILQKPPAGSAYGIQKGSGSTYRTIQTQISKGEDLTFNFTIELKEGPESAPDFRGPIVQGKLHERFIYIDIGTYAGEAGSVWGRRLKIPLRDITAETIGKLLANGQLILETQVAGTGKDGTPNCGTVKPFSGWHISDS